MSDGLLAEKVKHAVLVRATPERVWDALATADGLDGWFTTGAEIDARTGGHVVFRWRDWGVDCYNGEDGGPVVEAVRPSRLVFEWHTEGAADRTTTVSIDIAPHDAGTVVRLGTKSVVANASANTHSNVR